MGEETKLNKGLPTEEGAAGKASLRNGVAFKRTRKQRHRMGAEGETTPQTGIEDKETGEIKEVFYVK